MSKILQIFLLSLQIAALKGTHTLMGLATYIAGEGAFCGTLMLDDITVGYYNSVTKNYVARGNDTNEDDVIDANDLRFISENMLVHFLERSHQLRPDNSTESESYEVHQVMVLCEQSDNKHGHIISKTAYRGSAFDERFFDGKFTYQNYLKKRGTQLNRKAKPRVSLLQKANSDSGGSRVSCLATGFYPRHINLTLFRDGQPVSDHEITGGDLLPNDDGTYQMRKSLEISRADTHTYTCSVTHLSLDNKLDVTLGESFNSAILLALIVLALVLVFGIGVIIYVCKKRRQDSVQSGYSAASTSAEQETAT